MEGDGEDYEVGYGRPPVGSRFRKGQSGNPKGKTPGTKSVATIFHEVTGQLIDITENGEGRTVTKLEAIMLQLTTKAVSGDMKAVKEILFWHRIFEQSDADNGANRPDDEKDSEVMRKLIERMNKPITTDNPQYASQEPSHDENTDE